MSGGRAFLASDRAAPSPGRRDLRNARHPDPRPLDGPLPFTYAYAETGTGPVISDPVPRRQREHVFGRRRTARARPRRGRSAPSPARREDDVRVRLGRGLVADRVRPPARDVLPRLPRRGGARHGAGARSV